MDTLIDLTRYLAATLVFLTAGFVFAVGCVRIWSLDRGAYENARACSGGYRNLLAGRVAPAFRNDTVNTTSGMSVVERPGHPRILKQEQRVSDHALRHWM